MRASKEIKKSVRFLAAILVICITILLAPVVSADTELLPEGGDALDELMRYLHGMRAFDSALYGLEGSFEIVGEVSGKLEEDGDVNRIRLVAIRREDGVFDRGLILEIIPPEDDSFIIHLPEDVRGFQSFITLKNFMSPEKSEVFLTVNSGMRGGRFLIVAVSDRQGEVIFDSHNSNIPAFTGRFLSNFRAEIIVRETGEMVMIDLSHRRAEYIGRLIFNPSGTIRNNVTVRPSRISQIEFIDTDNDGVLEIRKVIDLNGASRDDRIAYAEAVLRFADGGWNVVDTWISPAEDLSRMRVPIRIN